MKKTFFLMAAAMLSWACQHSNIDNEPAQEGTATITFDVLNYEQVSLDEITRATTATTLAHLDMAIYDATSHALVSSKQTEPGDDTYGTFSATLPYGKYAFVFLGYEGSRKAVLDNPASISFADSNVPNCFLKTVEVTVSADSEASQSVSLARCVAAFSVRTEGLIPQTLKRISISMKGGGQQLDAFTGLANTTAERTGNTDASSKAGAESMTLTYYTFLPTEEAIMDFTVTASDTDGKVLSTRHFADVPMKINQRTIYRGNLFAAEERTQAFTLTLDSDAWDDQEYNY